MASQHLIFDADDTLWENGVFYETAVESFIDLVGHPKLSRAEIRHAVDEAERANIRRFGYSPEVFERSLLDCWKGLRGDFALNSEVGAGISALCVPLRTLPMALIDSVAETLAELAGSHRLYLLTKGSTAVQSAKIERSQLSGFFVETLIVPEKTQQVYERFLADRGLPPGHTWMIGNSPRHDILPALAAGIRTVLVPHPMTWSLDAAELPPAGPRFRVMEKFSSLRELFELS